MTVYTRKLNKVTGEFDTYCDGRLLTPEEVEAYEAERDGRWHSKLHPVHCECCGKHDYVAKKKDGFPRKKKCPDCGEYFVASIGIHVKADESQIRRKVEKYARDGMSKSQAKDFYETSIDRSRRTISGTGGASHYKAMVPDMDYMVKTGQAKPMNDKEIAEATKARKQVVEKHIGNKKNFKVTRSNNSQSSK